MGGSHQKKRKSKGHDRKGSFTKRRRSNKSGPSKERFWIIDCEDSEETMDGKSFDIEVLVTRCELLDDGRQVSTNDVNLTVNHENSGTEIAESNGDTESKGVDHTADDESPKEVVETNPTNAENLPRILSIGRHIPSEANVEQDVAASPEKAADDEANMLTVGVKKSRKAKSPFPKCHHHPELPNGDCGDGIVNPFPKEEVADKYWAQRRRLFKKFDKGIQLDRESWYSVTPEVIGSHISKRLVANGKDIVVLDPFCGCGGNAIAFASRPEVKTVVCVDKDVEKLKKAHHNASIYGVEQKLLLVLGNAFAVLSRYNGGSLIESPGTGADDDTASLPKTIDIVFLSPPWGGMDYDKVGKHGYDLTCVKIDAGNGEKKDGEFLLQRVAVASGHRAVGYFLPRNINGISFARSALKAGFTGPVVLEQNVVNGKLKTVTSYLGLGSE